MEEGGPSFAPTSRSFPVGAHVIFFRYSEDIFEVVDVVDGRRDLETYFAGD